MREVSEETVWDFEVPFFCVVLPGEILEVLSMPGERFFYECTSEIVTRILKLPKP